MGQSAVDGQDYLNSPDMIALTLGRVVAHRISNNLEVSHFHIRARLGEIIERGSDDLRGGVSPDMARAAMTHLNQYA
ncbi:hypothetical protein [Paracoccus shanxieyensis]|uniref:Uncharacterized protein n=1 Tax=Paracoccus shanxieyensis TaxID=2675752 RepID=A0A6L6IY04_9RHOB|nr:hypothetical protein [Paracoccus shanxieyensis]MTH64152.1 hypothetical protein [Paracoccus shanxieyensis]MTH87296.1 hypothetical protein [Paracoccus shanxieyensis]